MTRKRLITAADLATGVLVAFVALAPTSRPVAAQEVVAIEVGRIITGTSKDIEDGVVLVKNGRILDVGKDVEVPWNARVRKFPQGVLVPGFVACHTTTGLRASNEYLPEVPYITVLDGVDPSSPSFANALRDGITAVHVVPGNSTRIGGQGAVLRPFGTTVEAMTIKAPSSIKISLAPAPGENRMTHMASLRSAFLKLHSELDALAPEPKTDAEAGEAIAEGETGGADLASLLAPRPDWSAIDFEKIPREKIDEKRRPFVDLVRGEIPAMIYCPRAADVFKAFEIIDVHGLRATLVLEADAYRAADALAARDDLGPVVLDASLEARDRDPETGKERLYETGKILHDAGVEFAVTARPRSTSYRSATSAIVSTDGSYHLWYQAATLVRQGVPRAEAIRAITIHPARVVGLEHRLGSVEKGKDASFSIFTGDPLDVRSWVDVVYIEGAEAYSRAKDRELQRLLRGPSEPEEVGGK